MFPRWHIKCITLFVVKSTFCKIIWNSATITGLKGRKHGYLKVPSNEKNVATLGGGLFFRFSQGINLLMHVNCWLEMEGGSSYISASPTLPLEETFLSL